MLLMGCQSEIEKAQKELDEAIKIGRGDPIVPLKKGKSTDELIFDLHVLTLRYLKEQAMKDYIFATQKEKEQAEEIINKKLAKTDIYLGFFYPASQRLGNAYLKKERFEEAKSIYLAAVKAFDDYFSGLSSKSLDAIGAKSAKQFSESYLSLLDSLSKCYVGLSKRGDNFFQEFSLIVSKREKAIKRIEFYAEILPGLIEKEERKKESEIAKKKKEELKILEK